MRKGSINNIETAKRGILYEANDKRNEDNLDLKPLWPDEIYEFFTFENIRHVDFPYPENKKK